MLQSVVTALVLAGIFAAFKLFRDVDRLQTQTEPLLEWWKKTSLDALKIATNPTSERLTELADKYIANVLGKGSISAQEKQELIEGLYKVLGDKDAQKRQSASISLRFIEAREGIQQRHRAAKHQH